MISTAETRANAIVESVGRRFQDFMQGFRKGIRYQQN